MVLDNGFKDLVMGIQWYSDILHDAQNDHSKIIGAKIRELTNENPIEFGQIMTLRINYWINLILQCY